MNSLISTSCLDSIYNDISSALHTAWVCPNMDKHEGYPKIVVFKMEPTSQFMRMVIPKKTSMIQNAWSWYTQNAIIGMSYLLYWFSSRTASWSEGSIDCCRRSEAFGRGPSARLLPWWRLSIPRQPGSPSSDGFRPAIGSFLEQLIEWHKGKSWFGLFTHANRFKTWGSHPTLANIGVWIQIEELENWIWVSYD